MTGNALWCRWRAAPVAADPPILDVLAPPTSRRRFAASVSGWS